MKFLFKLIIFPLIFLYLLLFFLPKTQIYYFVLNQLAKEKVFVKNEKVDEKLFGMDLSNAVIEYNTIDMAKVKNTSLYTCFFDTKISINDIKIDESLKQFVPLEVDSVFIHYSVLNPLFITLNGTGKDFDMDGKFDILNQSFILNLNASKKFQSIYPMVLKQFKKTKEGRYYIEYKF